MDLKKFIKLGITILVIDFLYLSLISGYFTNQIMLVQKENIKINILGFIITYLALTFGLYYFIIKENKTPSDAFILGICIYAVYEYTNYTLFSQWKFGTTIIDTLWGGILFALVTYVNYNLI